MNFLPVCTDTLSILAGYDSKPSIPRPRDHVRRVSEPDRGRTRCFAKVQGLLYTWYGMVEIYRVLSHDPDSSFQSMPNALITNVGSRWLSCPGLYNGCRVGTV